MQNKTKIKIGLERLLTEEKKQIANLKVGLLCNQASVDSNYRHAADLFYRDPEINLTTLFGPQHGIRGDVQDNMIETAHATDAATGLPVFSLYSETRIPTAEMFDEIDVLVCDLQDVGCRIYTFIYTLANCMKTAGESGKKVIVCDRPNPINGVHLEGNLLENEYSSFVGMFPIPVRHGLTIGELALLFKNEFHIECDLEIIKISNWKRELWFDETDAAWVLPSPNMPTIEAATVFPGTVFFEGTQLSEGRGTTRPFEFVGAPYIVAHEYAAALNDLKLAGVYFRAANFQPTFQKHGQVTCGGVQIHVLDRNIFPPVTAGMALLQTAFDLYGDAVKWKNPPYEYVYDKNPFDVIAGTNKIRVALENKVDFRDVVENWTNELQVFDELRQPYLLY